MRLRSNKMAIGENLLYFLVWTVAILVPILNAKMMSEEHVYFVNILTAWLKILPYGIIFLLNNLIFAPKLLLRKHYAAYYLVSILYLVALFYSIEYYETTMRHSPFADSDLYIVHGRASFTDLAWYWNVLLGLFLQNTNNGIKIMFKSMSDEQKMVSLERQSLQAEMDYLKYQINPHFFMNTLNNIHALIDIDTEAAKETVIELSKMMRYVLYDSENAETSILNDIRFVENYIGLMRIRYTDDVDIRLDVEGTVPPEAKIPPLLLIVFVENAFKHGVSYNSPSYVHIAISCDGNTASCTVTNSRHDHTAAHDLQEMAAADTHVETDTKASSRTARRGRKTRVGRSGGNRLSGVNAASDSGKSSGMGLYNVRKRLDLLFGSNYTLKIDDSHEDRYEVKLTIPIKYD